MALGFLPNPVDSPPMYGHQEYTWLVVESYPSEKYEFVSWDDLLPIYGKNVPNHQPNTYYIYCIYENAGYETNQFSGDEAYSRISEIAAVGTACRTFAGFDTSTMALGEFAKAIYFRQWTVDEAFVIIPAGATDTESFTI